SHRSIDARMVVAQDQRPKGSIIVQVTLPIGIGNKSSRRLYNCQWPRYRPVRRVYAPRYDTLCAFCKIEIAHGYLLPQLWNVKKRPGRRVLPLSVGATPAPPLKTGQQLDHAGQASRQASGSNGVESSLPT